jgi:hypothetical protein
MTTRVCRPKTTPVYPDPPVVHNVSVLTTAAVYPRPLSTATIGPGDPDTAFHWGFMVTHDGLTESTGNPEGNTAHITALHSANVRNMFQTIPNTIFQCAKDHFGVFCHDPTPAISNDWTASQQGFAGKGLDDAVALINTFRRPESKLMIQLYGIPGWQGGLAIGDNYKSTAPDTLAHEDNFAAACARIALRYNGTGGQPNVEYFAVWNEMKGMDSYTVAMRQKYIRIYNKVWNAIKAVRPLAQIGGPYSKFISQETGMTPGASSLYGLSCVYNGGYVDARVLDLYHEFKRDCLYDFVSVDVWAGNDRNTGKQAYGPPNGTPDSDSVAPGLTAYQQMKSKMPIVFNWVRAKFPGTVPIICNEFYPQARRSNYTIGRGAGDIWTETDVENWVIECLNDIKQYGPGWICAWGEEAEPPRPFEYETTGVATTLASKLIAYEASL